MLNQEQSNFLKKHLNKITLHWTAGTWSQTFNDYHFCITFDGKEAHLKQTLSLYEIGAHTWHRNTGNIGISLCGMLNSHYEIQEQQIELCAKFVAELMIMFDIKEDDVQDHYFYAVLDHYFPERWDIGYPGCKYNGHELDLKPIIKRKALWYMSKIKDGTTAMDLTTGLK